jgi:lipid-A-disaccharide synthase-like uncharacterized protein
VGLQIEKGLRLARHARGRIRRKFAPDFIYEGLVDGSHCEILLRPYGLSGKVNSRDSSTRERALRVLHRAHTVEACGETEGADMMTTEHLWLSVGFLGQAFFSSRFLVQWIASERKKESVVPVSFWFFSIGGGTTLLIYAIYRQDPVFILGQGAGLVIYLRNLYLIRRKQRRLAEAGA